MTLTDPQFESLKRDLVCSSLPFLSVEDYARITNDTVGNVRQQIHQGRLPIKAKQKAKEKTFINMTAIRAEAQAVI
ncbi:MAG: DNA-binding protein [Alteromonadaceae bacterium]|nr:DNA-binding protein [Alteromonadaceae bacterium]